MQTVQFSTTISSARISRLGFNRIKIYDSVENLVEVSSSGAFQGYSTMKTSTVKSILHDISSGKEN